MPTRPRQRALPDPSLADQPEWHEIVHDLANDLGALKLLLAAVGMATDDEERSRHLATAKQAIGNGESRLKALRQAMRREAVSTSKAPAPADSKTRASRVRPKVEQER